MLLAIVALVTLVRFGFPRSSGVGFIVVLRLVVELVDLMRESVKSLPIRVEVRWTSKLEKTPANINISQMIHKLMVVNDIVHRRRKRHTKVAFVGFIRLKVLKKMTIGLLIIGTSISFSSVGVLVFVRGHVVCKDIRILHLGREERLNCMVKCQCIP